MRPSPDLGGPCPRPAPCPNLVEVGDDLVQQAQTLQPLLVDVALCVEDFEVRHGREHDTHAVVGLMVPVLDGGGQKTTLRQPAVPGDKQAQGRGPSAVPRNFQGRGAQRECRSACLNA